jgi:hypothetical protein
MSAYLKFTVPALPSEDRRPSPGFRRHATGGKMIQRRDLLSMLAGGASALLIGCSKRLPTYRYRLTVEVDTPRGLRRGSSVIEVRTVDQVAFPGPEAGIMFTKITGEAVPVDLPGGPTLFALLTNSTDGLDYPTYLALRTYKSADFPTNRNNAIRWLLSQRGAREVPRQLFPSLAYFCDVQDPTTMEFIDLDDTTKIFNGSRISRITIQITQDEPTQNLEKRMPWLRVKGEQPPSNRKIVEAVRTIGPYFRADSDQSGS